jgi:hypothetical protein
LQLRKPRHQPAKLGNHLRSIRFRQAFRGNLSNLRCVEADPDEPRIGIRLPGLEELFEVAIPSYLLPRNRAVDGDLVSFDVFEIRS